MPISNRSHRTRSRFDRYFFIALFCVGVLHAQTWGVTITLNDGRTLSGQVNNLSEVAGDPARPRTQGNVEHTPVLLVDNGYTRTYVARRHMTNIDPTDEPMTIIPVSQIVAEAGYRLGALGPIMNVAQFDAFGRRIVRMNMPQPFGPISIVQGITRITPKYTRVEALRGQKNPIIWDSRIATTSIPREDLALIIKNAVPQDDAHARLAVVRLYLQMNRYNDASKELEQIIKDFPDMEGMDHVAREMKQNGAKFALDEIEMRREAGQHRFTRQLLQNFPTEGIAGETLQHVKQVLTEYDNEQHRLDQANHFLSALVPEIKNEAHRQQAKKITEEIHQELTFNALGRMATLLQFGASETLSAEEKMALAISGWVVGSDYGTENLAVALSLYEIRDIVREYLREATEPRRKQLLEQIRSKEGAVPEQIARILKMMKPPLDLPDLVDEKMYGFFKHRISGLDENQDISYCVQLPPEYDPLRTYPMIITLPGAGSTPELQIDFWSGGVVWEGEGENKAATRVGQGMRRGYIVVSIDWRKPFQSEYEYSAREHHAVLAVLRDVSRRFSVNMDKVFLTGHDIGGDAAWDIALAHPEHWAGVLPIVGSADKYCNNYWETGKFLSFYTVFGEKDGTRLRDNNMILTRMISRGYDMTVVEYQGRGHESFSDEIQNMFDWMRRRSRDFYPKEFETRTMRRWDNYFWFVEMDELPPNAMLEPNYWDHAKNRSARMVVEGKVLANNTIRVSGGSGRTKVWLSPEMINFDQPIKVFIDNRRVKGDATPNLEVILEDARARADRWHPYWAMLEVP